MSVEPTAKSLANALADKALRQAQEHPITAVAAAAGVGLVLARGLPSPLVKLGVTLAIRSATNRLLGGILANTATGTPAEVETTARSPDDPG